MTVIVIITIIITATAIASPAQSTLMIGIVIPITIMMQDLKRLALSCIDISPLLLLPTKPLDRLAVSSRSHSVRSRFGPGLVPNLGTKTR